MIEKYEPTYITIVEGPPPDFSNVSNEWAYSMLEGLCNNNIAMCEMRTFSGPKMVHRCQAAWRAGRPARLDFPTGEGARGQLDIVAVRWEKVEEGDKLYLWVKI